MPLNIYIYIMEKKNRKQWNKKQKKLNKLTVATETFDSQENIKSEIGQGLFILQGSDSKNKSINSKNKK